LKYLLTQIGLEPERVKMYNLSAAMANEFVTAAKEITEQITKLGPSPLKVQPIEPNLNSKESKP
jgi:coenzyme F420-reducing hydrogenase delta subunit